MVGNNATRRFLKMVWGQPVVVRANILFEKCPGTAGQAAQLLSLALRNWGGFMTDWTTDPVGDLWGQKPAYQHREGNGQGNWIDQNNGNPQDNRKNRRG